MGAKPEQLARDIADTLEEKKGENILVLDLTEVCSFTDFFVLCSTNNERTLRALSEAVRTQTKAGHSMLPHHTEGDPSSGWILLDYGDVILHLFLTTTRNYYRLEDLWRNGKVLLHMP
jgi:ribosome-associated protein